MLKSDMYIAVKYINKDLGMVEVILRSITSKGEVTKTIRGLFSGTTKNRLEILGLLAGLKSYKKPSEIHVYSNSDGLLGPINQRWLSKWAENGWKTTKSLVKNADLWQQVYEDINYMNLTISTEAHEFSKCQEVSLDNFEKWNIKVRKDKEIKK